MHTEAKNAIKKLQRQVRVTNLSQRVSPCQLEVSDLSFHVNTGFGPIQLLDKVSFSLPPGSFLAIMGASGCGKSTLIKALAGRAHDGRVTGRVRFGGLEVDSASLARAVGFVPQEDLVFEDLTVRQNLEYSADLRLVQDVSLQIGQAGMKDSTTALEVASRKQTVQRIVDDALRVLGLVEVQHQLVGSAERRCISGGQRKRVNIGMELVAGTSFIVLDEPTSGLDAQTANDVMETMYRLSRFGITIITVIHQPRRAIFTRFEQLLLLAKGLAGGQTVYFGPTAACIPYLSQMGFELPARENPADFLIDVVAGDVPRRGDPHFTASSLAELWSSRGASFLQKWSANAAKATTAGKSAALASGSKIWESAPGGRTAAPSLSLFTEDSALPPSYRAQLTALFLAKSGSRAVLDADQVYDVIEQLCNQQITVQHDASTLHSVLRRVTTVKSRLSPSNRRSVVSSTAIRGELRTLQDSNPSDFTDSDMHEVIHLLTVLVLQGAAALVARDQSVNGDKELQTVTLPAFLASVEALISDRLPSVVGSAAAGGSRMDSASMESKVALSSFQSSPSPRRTNVLPNPRSMPLPMIPHDDEDSYNSEPSASASFDDAPGASTAAGTGAVATQPKWNIAPRTSTRAQFAILLRRCTAQRFARFSDILSSWITTVASAAAIGIVYGSSSDLDSILQLAWLNSLVMGVLGATSVLPVFERDLLVFQRERDSGVSTLAFFASRNVDHIIDLGTHSLLFCALVFALTVPWGTFAPYWGLLVLPFWAGSGLGMVISLTVSKGYSFVAAVLIPMVLGGFFSGVRPELSGFNAAVKVVAWFSFTRWAAEASAIQEVSYLPAYTLPSPRYYAENTGFNYDAQDTAIMALLLMGLGWRILALFCLYTDLKNASVQDAYYALRTRLLDCVQCVRRCCKNGGPASTA